MADPQGQYFRSIWEEQWTVAGGCQRLLLHFLKHRKQASSKNVTRTVRLFLCLKDTPHMSHMSHVQLHSLTWKHAQMCVSSYHTHASPHRHSNTPSCTHNTSSHIHFHTLTYPHIYLHTLTLLKNPHLHSHSPNTHPHTHISSFVPTHHRNCHMHPHIFSTHKPSHTCSSTLTHTPSNTYSNAPSHTHPPPLLLNPQPCSKGALLLAPKLKVLPVSSQES